MVAAAVVCFRFSHLGSCLSQNCISTSLWIHSSLVNPTMLIPPSSSRHSLLNHLFPALNHQASLVLGSLRSPFRLFNSIWRSDGKQINVTRRRKWNYRDAILLQQRLACGLLLLSASPLLPSVWLRSGRGRQWSPGVSCAWGPTAVSPVTDPDHTNPFPCLQLRKRHKLFCHSCLSVCNPSALSP